MSDELKELGLNLRVVDVGELTPHPRNYNHHSSEQVGELEQSLDDFGQYKNIVAWRDPDDGVLYILAGHGLWEGAQSDGSSRIVVNDRSDLTRAQAMALMFSDNFTTSTDFDYPLLADIVTDLEFPADVPGLSEEVKIGILELAHGPNSDVWQDAFDKLPSGARAPFIQVTFTLHDSQAEQVKRALKTSKGLGDFVGSPNENSNGNALARICEMFITQNGQS